MLNFEDVVKIFDNAVSKFLVVVSILGIVLTSYPAYKSITYDVEKKISIVERWNNLGYERIDSDHMKLLYQEVCEEISNGSNIYGDYFNSLKPSYKLDRSLLLKFITGGILFLIVYGTAIIFILCSKCSGMNDFYGILLRNKNVLIIWLVLSIINMLIPMFSAQINYIFIPCVLTFLVSCGEIIWKDCYKRYSAITSGFDLVK